MVGAVVGAIGEDRCRGALSKDDAACARRRIAHQREVLHQRFVEIGALRRKKRNESVMRSLRDGRFGRCVPDWRVHFQIAAVPMRHRVKRIEDRDVDDCHCARRSTGSKLLAENARLVGRGWRVVESSALERDCMPFTQTVRRARAPRADAAPRRAVGVAKARAVGRPHSFDCRLRPCGNDWYQSQCRCCTQQRTARSLNAHEASAD